ncbi:Oxysterol-binding protein-related protein 3 [Smittium culicis]|uniref:Oxysterol-binding protein-related protein 3 n=1 Tax=Smittium culicis TaxID=133412 RepID=A0A1R1YTA9_9FUNG|nr:Oxysterol-binding protein-related protein 3 [Smittium culicis]
MCISLHSGIIPNSQNQSAILEDKLVTLHKLLESLGNSESIIYSSLEKIAEEKQIPNNTSFVQPNNVSNYQELNLTYRKSLDSISDIFYDTKEVLEVDMFTGSLDSINNYPENQPNLSEAQKNNNPSKSNDISDNEIYFSDSDDADFTFDEDADSSKSVSVESGYSNHLLTKDRNHNDSQISEDEHKKPHYPNPNKNSKTPKEKTSLNDVDLATKNNNTSLITNDLIKDLPENIESDLNKLKLTDTSADPPSIVSLAISSRISDYKRRLELPSNEPPEPVNMLSLMRKFIGKDLSRIRMPIEMNEPLSTTQTLAEELEYSYLLDKAAGFPDSMDRLMFVMAFAVSAYAARKSRISYKPFNPMLGETYELVRPDLGFRFISEKVSHHPMIVSCYADSPNYTFSQNCNVKTRFWGRSMELSQSSLVHISLPSNGDHFTYSKASTLIKGILTGNRSIEFTGQIKIINHTTGDSATLNFKESTMFSDSNDIIEGFIVSANPKVPKRKIKGKWSGELFWENGNENVLLWKSKNYIKELKGKQYGLSEYSKQLNEISIDMLNSKQNPRVENSAVKKPSSISPESILQKINDDYKTLSDSSLFLLPLTDSRLRPDLRLYENGNYKLAESVKGKLEDNQRVFLNKIEEGAESDWVPKWFEFKSDPSGETEGNWEYKGGYWKAAFSNSFDEFTCFNE